LTREYYQVPVAEVVRETGDACSLVLDVPPALAVVFGYRRAADHHGQADRGRVRVELDS